MTHMSDLLQNTANIFVFILLVNRLYPYIANIKPRRRKAAIGLLFGISGLLSMIMPIRAGDGITVDLKAVLAGMAGLLGGPAGGVLAAAIVGVYRVMLGGSGMLPGLLCITAAAATGAIVHVKFRQNDDRLRLSWRVPFLFGLWVAALQLAMTAFFTKPVRDELLRHFALPLLVLYPLAALLFYYFMTVEWIQYRDAMFDRVTRLPRSERLTGKWRRWIRKGQPFSFVILNLERLRSVNDLHGVQVGNELLRECGSRLSRQVPAGGSVSRYNGRDFLVFLPGYDMLQTLIWIVDVKKQLAEPYRLEDVPYRPTFSTGLAVFEGGTATLEELLLQAETALRHAMDSGSDQTVPYESRLAEQLRYRTSLEKDLGLALERGQFQLHYQPQYELDSGKLRGFEALIRWHHPDWGLVSPAEFIPMAENSRQIIAIGEWVLRTACRMAIRLRLNDASVTMAVNVSTVQLLEPDFPDKVFAILEESGLNSDLLELELTESTMVQSFERAAEQMRRLKERNIRLALDDFGVGYSSLSYLRRLPFDLIKIDRSFIEDIGRSRDDRMTKSIIDWVRELRYGIVAEGLESYDQLYWLKKWKCDIAQGYLFSKPLSEEDLLLYLRQASPIPISGLST
ncbi:putative bifunctional diguanylate cyclase/phosphodiesterase [Cohnella caldifontis]|uniref:putative bifunctional diguanylate cyclase/phosphodiesterase n=1 Tax=Cohnella caldifontis TaxID=3027471 RepID=UPI0023EBA91B|nr:EAL domain-containing protein [Cohnella sp. YIM B05605]